jgi:hypothetical protein
MSIVSISRIQQRRGKISESGLPQLASGELAWCIDSQELYIGNGSVAEGAPAVGNTKILTELAIESQSDLLSVFQHTYLGNNGTVITGEDSNHPIFRSIQNRLDDRVSTRAFGVIGDGVTDVTISLQRAIDELFLNPAGKAHYTPDARITLEIPAGDFKITGTIYIPSHAKIVGAGKGKTRILHSGSSTAFRFVNAMSSVGNPASMGSTLIDLNLDGNFVNDSNDVTYLTQPQYIELIGMDIITTSSNQNALQLDAVRNSIFANLTISGTWGGVYNANSKGIAMYAFTSTVTCEKNIFENITINGFSYAVHAKQDIINNLFQHGFVEDVRQGFVLGFGADGSSTGEHYGPRNTNITNFHFSNVKQHAVYIALGSGNNTNDLILANVGNDGAGVNAPKYPQIYFNTFRNASNNTTSDRSTALSLPNLIFPYIAEVSGHGNFDLIGSQQFSLGEQLEFYALFRLPLACSASGLPIGTTSHSISYIYRSTSAYSRAGVLSILVDLAAADIKITDDYSFVGVDAEVNSLALSFQASLLDFVGQLYTGAPGQIPYTIGISYMNTFSGDSGYLDFTYVTLM